MILETLSINNFRVFSGENTFDLIPRVKYNKKRPIILFGGLNGAGKTTTLTAVRLVLYGKQSLGMGVSQKEYDDYLAKSIHRTKTQAATQPNSASIELTFTYASQGVENCYTVKRHWMVKGKNQTVTEHITIAENDEPLSELSDEQCQGFLNELIPIGVSDLFFFDGEKISELAEDTKGEALGDSIKKLLGLDLIETLDADLGILLRNESKKGSSKDRKRQIANLEKELEQHEIKASHALEQFNQSFITRKALDSEGEKLENQLSSRGGAWAATREIAIKKQATLHEEQRLLEESLREVFSGNYPFTIAANFAQKTLVQLRSEYTHKRHTYTAQVLNDRMKSLTKSLHGFLDQDDFQRVNNAIQNELGSFTDSLGNLQVIHDVSDTLFTTIETTVNNALTQQKLRLTELHKRLSDVSDELDKAGKNIARAPEEAQIKPIIDKISKTHEKRAMCIALQKKQVELHKRHLRDAISVARQLDKLTSAITSDEEQVRTLQYATGAKALLKGFSTELAKRKVKDLETEFVNSFYRLSRKEDINLTASIDPKTFTVSLLSEDGREVNKDELSAGEKQIYAISILEALARTSGRRLPIIIDTPLGRLDSVHRSKLINNYFPYASHQMIILSTDTEVDEAFYHELSPSISHAFKLDYEPTESCTRATEAYFWREQKANAS
ncbi:MAG: DNA sulfur modification protein DndD [Gammaproteobacteria bacterium]|nr:DNA sulfur modification protein DndD [Gammaproteobacteria bacterium]MCF6259263.1 DNA sulfur modification protein DndD [Gammaproteobacteria bacterium]